MAEVVPVRFLDQADAVQETDLPICLIDRMELYHPGKGVEEAFRDYTGLDPARILQVSEEVVDDEPEIDRDDPRDIEEWEEMQRERYPAYPDHRRWPE